MLHVRCVVRNLEACVEELRTDVVSGKSQVLLTDVEAMVLALGHIGRSLASLRGHSMLQFANLLWCLTVSDGGTARKLSRCYVYDRIDDSKPM